jgi:hypothetical protein
MALLHKAKDIYRNKHQNGIFKSKNWNKWQSSKMLGWHLQFWACHIELFSHGARFMELSLISGPIILSYYKFLGLFDKATFKSLGILCRTIVKIVA